MPEITGYAAEEITQAHEEAVRRSRELLEAGRHYRQSSRESIWKRSERQYEGDHWSQTAAEDVTADLIVINVSFSTVNTIIPYITSEEPSFLVSPFSADATAKNARLQQAALNRTWRRSNGRQAIRTAAKDYLIYGDGYVKTSWDIIDKVTDDGRTVEVVDTVVDRISPWDVWVDPFSNGIEDARWVCERLFLTRREFEMDERYDQSMIDDITWGVPTEADEEDVQREIGETSEQYAEIYEFYDRIDRKMYAFCEQGTEKPLRVIEEIECPIVPLPNYLLPRGPYHMGELEQLWPMQQELNKTRSQLITHRRRNIAKYVYRSGTLSEDGMAALTSSVINDAIEVLGDLPLDSVIQPLQLANLSPEAYGSSEQAMRDIYEISGVNEYLRGATPEIRRTATEASIIEGASNVKTRAKLDDVEQAVRDAGEYLLAIMREVYPETDVEEMSMVLTGPEAEQIARIEAGEEADSVVEEDPEAAAEILDQAGDVESYQLKPEAAIFVGEYEVEVEKGSTEMRNPVFKEQKYREMAMALVNMVPALAESGVQLNLRKVLELWFEASGIDDVEGMFEASAVGGMQQALPPEVASIMGAGAGPGTGGTPQGMPNIGGVQAPAAPPSEATSGMMPPA